MGGTQLPGQAFGNNGISMRHTRLTNFFVSQAEQGQHVQVRCRPVFLLLLVSMLAACADLPDSTSSVNPDSRNGLLSSWRSIESGIQETGSATAAVGQYIQLGRPVSVAAWADYVYIADAGRQAILRYDLRRETFSVYYRMQVAPATRIMATVGEYLYVADTIQGRILYLDPGGRLLREIKDFNLKRPVAIAEDFSRGRILVADAFYNQVLAFNKLGRLLKIFKPVDETAVPIAGIIDMVVKGEKIYFLDRSLRQVVVTDLDGHYLYTIEKNRLQQPVAMQVDESGRIIIADAFDNSLLFLTEDRQHKTTAMTESVMTMQLADMDLHENWLYLADAAAARIQIMKLHYPVAATGQEK